VFYYDQARSLFKAVNCIGDYLEILNYLCQFSLPTKPEKKLIDSCFAEYHFDMPAIKKACDETIGSNKPNLKYVDGILKGKNLISEEKTSFKNKSLKHVRM
jgi:hypothetical protein